MSGKYNTGTEQAVKSALLKLLAKKSLFDISVTELAREAGISRTTFYEHYGNPSDVYDELMGDFSRELSPVLAQVACSDRFKPTGVPFCARLRSGGELGSLVDDDRFLGSFLSRSENLEEHDLYGVLTGAGYTAVQAKALCTFQLAGCYSAAQSTQATDAEWEEVKAVIDRFILGGVSACLASVAKPARE